VKFSIQTSAQIAVHHFRSGSQPVSCSMDVGDSVLSGKAVGTWGWLFTYT